MKTISSDAFIRRLTEILHRDLTLVNDNHVWFRSNDLNVMLHVWYEDGFYSGGSSERNSPPGTFVWATSLTPIKQWLVMYNFDLLRACLDLQPFHISFKRLMPAPGWSHRPGTNDYSVELCHDDQPTNIFTQPLARTARRDRSHRKHRGSLPSPVRYTAHPLREGMSDSESS